MSKITKDDIRSYEVTADDLNEFSKYFKIVHHTKGRIRLRASLALKEAIGNNNVDTQSLFELVNSISAILDFKFNKLIGSITIVYDPNELESSFWEDWILGKNLDSIAGIINKFKKDI